MEPTKESYFSELEQWVTEPMHITASVDELDTEIRENCLQVGIRDEIAKMVSVEEFSSFIVRCIENRRAQLTASNVDVDMLFYAWHDEMAGQFRFNVINANHPSLPFGADVNIVSQLEIIVSAFLRSKYLDGIPWQELQAVSVDDDESALTESSDAEYVLDVYLQRLIR